MSREDALADQIKLDYTQADLTPRDVVLTGEMRHHDMLTVLRRGCSAVLLGHWASERPVLTALAERLGELLPGVDSNVSEADCDPTLAALQSGC